MIIELSNKINIRDDPSRTFDMVKDRIVQALTIPNPTYEEALKNGRSTYGISPHIHHYEFLHNGIAVPRGCRRMVLEGLDGMGLPYEVADYRSKFDRLQIDSSVIKYRPYQPKAVLDLITKGDEGLLIAPAGSGKTVIGISVVAVLGQPTLWITHTNRLAKQVIERLAFFLPDISGDDIGFIGGGKFKVGKVFTVGMVQSLVRKTEDELLSVAEDFGLIIVDEAHHVPASTFLKVIGQFNPYYLYGLTATPYRRDKLENIMFQAIGPPLAVIDYKQVEKDGGIMVPVVKYRPIFGKKVDDSNTQRILTNHIIDNSSRNNTIVSDVVREAVNNNMCIVVSDRKAHCETLYELIKLGWERTGIATGDYSSKHQDEMVKKLETREITVIVVTFDLLGEGFDVDILNRGFICTPFRSERKAEQLVGRIQRTAADKVDAIVYDYVDVDIGVFKNQFYAKHDKECRHRVYERLGMRVEPYNP